MAQIVLADEINRATPKTQSALLECMEERHMTVDGVTYPMPEPFLVIATQNPIEYEGTFALPEAQLDRFMLRLRLGYPQPLEEIVILDEQKRAHPLDEIGEVATVDELKRAAAGRSRGVRRLHRLRLHRPARERHANPSRRLPRARRREARWPSIAQDRPSRRSSAATTSSPTTSSRWPSPPSPIGSSSRRRPASATWTPGRSCGELLRRIPIETKTAQPERRAVRPV